MTRRRPYKPSWERQPGDPTFSGDVFYMVVVVCAAVIVLAPFFYCGKAMLGLYGWKWAVGGWAIAVGVAVVLLVGAAFAVDRADQRRNDEAKAWKAARLAALNPAPEVDPEPDWIEPRGKPRKAKSGRARG